MHNVPPAPAVRIDPGAAAASLTETTGRPLEPGAVFAVYRLGRTAFHTAVIRRVDDEYVLLAERTEAIGGAEFDGLLLAYLSGRHPDAGRRLWSRLDDPADAGDQRLRATLIDKIMRAREELSEREFTVITVPAADVKLPITREELDSRIRELIATTVDLLEETLEEAGVAPQEIAGFFMVGGAARTPLAATELRRRFGIGPVLVVPSARVLTAEAAPAPTRELPLVEQLGEEAAAPRRRGSGRAILIAAALIVIVVAGAAFGARLGDDDPDATGALPEATEEPASSEAVASPDPTLTVSAEETSESPSPEEEEEQADPTEAETESEDEEPETESAPTGAVPDVIGLSTAEARSAVDDAGFAGVDQSGKQRGVFEFYDDCEVIEQQPEAGTVLPLSEKVDVTFSYGTDDSEC